MAKLTFLIIIVTFLTFMQSIASTPSSETIQREEWNALNEQVHRIVSRGNATRLTKVKRVEL